MPPYYKEDKLSYVKFWRKIKKRKKQQRCSFSLAKLCDSHSHLQYSTSFARMSANNKYKNSITLKIQKTNNYDQIHITATDYANVKFYPNLIQPAGPYIHHRK